MDDTRYDEMKALQQELVDQSAPGREMPEWQDASYDVKRYSLNISEQVATHCVLEVDTGNEIDLDGKCFNFEVSLGPVNARKMIAFLKSLPEEPEEEEPEVLPAPFPT